jgi:hypothetical protein
MLNDLYPLLSYGDFFGQKDSKNGEIALLEKNYNKINFSVYLLLVLLCKIVSS